MVLNKDGYYKWTAKADHDNPYYTKGADHSELNKTEGYEVLHFINHIIDKHWTKPVTQSTYEKIERMIKVSPGKQTHKAKADWILANWKTFTG